MLPRDAAGATAHAWLRTELHVTDGATTQRRRRARRRPPSRRAGPSSRAARAPGSRRRRAPCLARPPALASPEARPRAAGRRRRARAARRGGRLPRVLVGPFARPAAAPREPREHARRGRLALALACAAARGRERCWKPTRAPARADDRFELLCVGGGGAAAPAATTRRRRGARCRSLRAARDRTCGRSSGDTGSARPAGPAEAAEARITSRSTPSNRRRDRLPRVGLRACSRRSTSAAGRDAQPRSLTFTMTGRGDRPQPRARRLRGCGARIRASGRPRAAPRQDADQRVPPLGAAHLAQQQQVVVDVDRPELHDERRVRRRQSLHERPRRVWSRRRVRLRLGQLGRAEHDFDDAAAFVPFDRRVRQRT